MVVSRRIRLVRRLARSTRRTLAIGHRTIVVPLLDGTETERALTVACRLAADEHARLLLLAPLVVDPELPFDAHFHDEERELRGRLARERAVVETYGIVADGRVVRTRPGQLGDAVARAVDESRASLVVLGVDPLAAVGLHRPDSRDIRSVLRDAPCRVLLLGAAPERAVVQRAA